MSENESGHIAHTKTSEQIGLPGTMRRPIKVTMIGAGSGFTPTITSDIFQTPGNLGGTIALVDIDPNRLEPVAKIVSRMAEKKSSEDGAHPWKVIASTDRVEVMKDSDYIVICVEVSGIDCVRFDNDIPAKYGIDQCIGDTIGPGGLFKGLRTIPVFLDILRDAEKYCPRVLILNYTNPMGMMCLAAGRTSRIPVVGLCHSVQGTSHLLAGRAEVPYNEMTWECAGINHLAWFTKLEHKGRDLYPILMKKAAEDIAGSPSNPDDTGDLFRKDMMLHFGAFITESSGHLSEYLPYYRKRKDLLEKYARPGYDGGSSFYANEWPGWRKGADEFREKLVSGQEQVSRDRSWEYGSWIIEAIEKDVPHRIHGNVMNTVAGGDTVITNLPADGCVEVSCIVDQTGVHPARFGKLPPQMAAISASNMQMIGLAADAVITRSKEAAIHALMLDPLCAAVCSPSEIKAMTLELFEAEERFLPGYK